MIKAAGKTGLGLPLLMLGLSGENVTRLMADEPIMFNVADLGLPPMVVVIVGGRTEKAIVEKLRAAGMVLQEVQVHDEPR